MEREIKFRAKRINTNNWTLGEFAYGGLSWLDGDKPREWFITYTDDIEGEETTIGSILVDHITIGQYVGLKDKNGKEIYEGDILTNGIDYFRVWIDDGSILIGGLNKEWDKYLNSLEVANCSIIGNIYENSELLK